MQDTTSPSIQPSHVRESLSQHMLVDGFKLVLDLEKSSGSRLYDSVSGKEYLDLFGYFGSAPLGMNHPRMHRPEVEAELLRAARHKPSNSDVYSVEMARFVQRFGQYAIPPELPYAFFISGGALAVENAMKAAFDWKTRKNAQSGIPAAGHRILHFRQAFHGRSGYTMSVTNTDPWKVKYFPKFDWPRVLNPKIVWPLEKNLETVQAAEKQSEMEIRQAFERYPGEIAGILIETIQGEGGDNHFRPEFFRKLREIANEYDALLIFDEVQCGFGTTGRWWAWQHHGVAPDVLCFGKKAQVCGILAGSRLDEVEEHVFKRSSRINSTWGGNLVDMVRSGHILDSIVEEKLLDNISARGHQAFERLEELQDRYPALVSQVRGLGGFIAFDLPTPELRARVRTEAFERRLLVLACGEKSIRFRPALSITEEEMGEALDILGAVLKDLAAELD